MELLKFIGYILLLLFGIWVVFNGLETGVDGSVVVGGVIIYASVKCSGLLE